MATVTVSYVLVPPEGTKSPPSLMSSCTRAFAVDADKTTGKEYYEALKKSIDAARERVGEELTAWRDAVGNAEVGKEKVVKAAQADDDDDDDEAEQV